MANPRNVPQQPPVSQPKSDDEIKHVEFLYADLKDFRDKQDGHYKDLITKTTFLSGFIVTILTLYGTYATQVNGILRIITLATLGAALLVLSGALHNRTFYQAEMSEIDVDSMDYFHKVYQAIANMKRACDENEKPLQAMARFIRWGARIFIIGVALLVLSFCLSSGNVVKSKQYANRNNPQTIRTTFG